MNPGVVEKKVLQLKLAESVKVTKKFPGLVRIEVKEYPHVAFQQKNEQWQAVLANGAGIPLESIPVPDKPILTGWEGHEALKLELCRTLAEIPNDRLSDVSEILPDPSSSYEDRILFYSRSSFVVTTTVGKLPEKLGYFHEIVEDLRDRGIASGKLILLEADHYVPFADMGPGTE